jgi:hypothetical protein
VINHRLHRFHRLRKQGTGSLRPELWHGPEAHRQPFPSVIEEICGLSPSPFPAVLKIQIGVALQAAFVLA